MSSIPRIVSPVGEFIFPALTTPSIKFNPDGDYRVNLRITTAEKDLLVGEIVKVCKDQIAALAVQHKFEPTKCKKAAFPWIPALDREKHEIPGKWDIKLKQAAIFGKDRQYTYIPKLFDHKLNPWDMSKAIGFGSTGRINFAPLVYFVKSELGFSLKLVGAQIITYKSPQLTAADLGFGEVEAPDAETAATDQTFKVEFAGEKPVVTAASPKLTAELQELVDPEFQAMLEATTKK